MTTLDTVLAFARQAHAGQMRKFADEPYIQHPIRVMEECRSRNGKLPVLCAALLHDVLEDTAVTPAELESFLKNNMPGPEALHTFELVTDLTDVYVKQAFPKLNRRTRKSKEKERMQTIHPDAQTVKYADIIDNCRNMASKEPDFAPRFLQECKALLAVMDKGDTVLRDKAMHIVNTELEKLKDRR